MRLFIFSLLTLFLSNPCFACLSKFAGDAFFENERFRKPYMATYLVPPSHPQGKFKMFGRLSDGKGIFLLEDTFDKLLAKGKEVEAASFEYDEDRLSKLAGQMQGILYDYRYRDFLRRAKKPLFDPFTGVLEMNSLFRWECDLRKFCLMTNIDYSLYWATAFSANTPDRDENLIRSIANFKKYLVEREKKGVSDLYLSSFKSLLEALPTSDIYNELFDSFMLCFLVELGIKKDSTLKSAERVENFKKWVLPIVSKRKSLELYMHYNDYICEGNLFEEGYKTPGLQYTLEEFSSELCKHPYAMRTPVLITTAAIYLLGHKNPVKTIEYIGKVSKDSEDFTKAQHYVIASLYALHKDEEADLKLFELLEDTEVDTSKRHINALFKKTKERDLQCIGRAGEVKLVQQQLAAIRGSRLKSRKLLIEAIRAQQEQRAKEETERAAQAPKAEAPKPSSQKTSPGLTDTSSPMVSGQSSSFNLKKYYREEKTEKVKTKGTPDESHKRIDSSSSEDSDEAPQAVPIEQATKTIEEVLGTSSTAYQTFTSLFESVLEGYRWEISLTDVQNMLERIELSRDEEPQRTSKQKKKVLDVRAGKGSHSKVTLDGDDFGKESKKAVRTLAHHAILLHDQIKDLVEAFLELQIYPAELKQQLIDKGFLKGELQTPSKREKKKKK